MPRKRVYKYHESAWARYIYRHYGVTVKQYKEMERTQEGLCALCGEKDPKRKLSIDHDHVTGIVRGLLCSRCNSMLGHAKDDVRILSMAVAYLIRKTVTIKIKAEFEVQ